MFGSIGYFVIIVLYLMKHNWNTFLLGSSCRNVACHSMRAIKVVVKVAAVAIESIKVPVEPQLATSVLYKLRSQVLENHVIPQEL